MSTVVIERHVDRVRIDERWVLVRLPVVDPLPLPRVGNLNSATAVAELYE